MWDVPYWEDYRHVQRDCDVTDTTSTRVAAKVERSPPVRSGECWRDLVFIVRAERPHLLRQLPDGRAMNHISLILSRLAHARGRWHERYQRRARNVSGFLGMNYSTDA